MQAFSLLAILVQALATAPAQLCRPGGREVSLQVKWDELGWKIRAPSSQTYFGQEFVHIANAGDYDGDGADDLAASLFWSGGCGLTRPSGDLFLLSGRTGEQLHRLEGPIRLLDVELGKNGCLLGVSEDGSSFTLERRTAWSQQAQWSLTSDESSVGSMASAVFVPDVNGDRIQDVAIASAWWRSHPQSNASIALLCGATGACIWTDERDPEDPANGRAVASSGDVDRDGVADVGVLLFNPWRRDPPPRVDIRSGRDGLVIRSIELHDLRPKALRSVGDLDGDGCGEMLVTGQETVVLSMLGARDVTPSVRSPRWTVPVSLGDSDALILGHLNPFAGVMHWSMRSANGVQDLEPPLSSLDPYVSPDSVIGGRFGQGSIGLAMIRRVQTRKGKTYSELRVQSFGY